MFYCVRGGYGTEVMILKHIQEWIEPGTIIMSDCWKAYVNLQKYGYIHKTVNHSG